MPLFVSSLLQAAEYAPRDKRLTIDFVKGEQREYLGVPNDIADALYDSPSKGRFYLEFIADRYDWHPAGEEDAEVNRASKSPKSLDVKRVPRFLRRFFN